MNDSNAVGLMECGCSHDRDRKLIINPDCEAKYIGGSSSTSFMDDHYLLTNYKSHPKNPELKFIDNCEYRLDGNNKFKLYDPNEGLSDTWREYGEAQFSGQKLLVFIHEVLKAAQRDAKKNNSTTLLFKVLEELGEYGTAKAGHKDVEESPCEELVDILITVLSLYSLEGGSIEHLGEYGAKKLRKYNRKMGHE